MPKPTCNTVVDFKDFKIDVILIYCNKDPIWQGDNEGFACDNHKDNIFNPKPISEPKNNPKDSNNNLKALQEAGAFIAWGMTIFIIVMVIAVATAPISSWW